MGRIVWGSPGTRTFEVGVDRVVFYPEEGPGVPWNGIINVKEEPANGEVSTSYVDGVPFRSQKNTEEFAAIVQAYTSPVEFDEYEGFPGLSVGRRPKTFGLCYRTLIGNDVEGVDHAYKLHIVYNASATATDGEFGSLDQNGLSSKPFSWGMSTTPIDIPDAKAAAHLIIDTSIAYPEAVAEIENLLYGTDTSEARLPEPEELLAIFEEHSILLIIDHGDGTWTARGPDDVVYMLDADTFAIDWPTVVYLDEDTYRVSSL